MNTPDKPHRTPMDSFSEIALYMENKHYPRTDFTQMEFKGPLDVEALSQAFAEALQLVPIFSSHLQEGREGFKHYCYWELDRERRNELIFVDCRDRVKTPFDPMEFFTEFHGVRITQNINLKKEFPFVGYLLRIFDDRYIFSIRYHHSAMDPYKGYRVITAMLAGYHERIKGRPPEWINSLGMASLSNKPASVPKENRNIFILQRTRDVACNFARWGSVPQLASEKVLDYKKTKGRHSLRVVLRDPKLIEGLSNRARRHLGTVNDLLMAVIHQKISEWNKEHDHRHQCLRIMLVSSLKGRVKLSRHTGAGLGGLTFVSKGFANAALDDLIVWFRDYRTLLLDKQFDIKFNRWMALYFDLLRSLPLRQRRRVWHHLINSITINAYISNLGVVWPKVVDGRPTLDSMVQGAGDFVISDIHSSPSIGRNVGVGVTIRTHNGNMYINFVCDRYRFREYEARAFVDSVYQGLINAG